MAKPKVTIPTSRASELTFENVEAGGYGEGGEQMQVAQDAAAARAGESTKKSFAQNLLGTSGALLNEEPLTGEEKYQAGLRAQRAGRIRSIVANFRSKMRGGQA